MAKQNNSKRPKKTPDVATVDTCSPAYNAMAAKWEKIDALLGGTEAMRYAGTTFLPQMEKEKDSVYERRLAESFLFNAYADTVRKVSAKPFTKPVVVEGNEKLHEQLQLIMDDADRAGSDLTQLGRELFWIGINRGIFHILVDYPQGPSGDAPTETKDAEEKSGKRPVFIPIWPDQVIAWQTREGSNGETILSQVRIHEKDTRYGDGDSRFEEQTIDRIRVYYEDRWEIWEKGPDDDAYKFIKDGVLSRKGIPLITGYFEPVDYMVADPPLEDLAWLNIEHWQSSSDQRNILRFARTGVWFLKGIKEEEANNLSLGPSALFWTKNKDADMKVVEHSGGSISAGERDITKLEERMQLMGLRPFLQQARGATATSQTINEVRGETEIQAWIRSIELAFMSAYVMGAEWIKTTLHDEFRIDISTEFALSLRETQDIMSLIEARKNKDIDRETMLKELKRRRILGEDIIIADVMAALEAEGPDLSEMGTRLPGGDAGDGSGADEDDEDDEE